MQDAPIAAVFGVGAEILCEVVERFRQFHQIDAEVIGAAVTRADDTNGTALMVIQSTQQSTAAPRPTVVKYRIQVELQKVDDRWLLSGIAGL